jgi:hypothetical protein
MEYRSITEDKSQYTCRACQGVMIKHQHDIEDQLIKAIDP